MSYNPPKKNTAYTFYASLVSRTTGQLQANPTLATGDVKVSIDGGAFNNLATLPVVTPAAGVAVKVSLSAAEMNGDNIQIAFIDAADAEWNDVFVSLQTTTQQFEDIPTAAEIADAVWDEVLTGVTHNIATSAGRRLRALGAMSIADGTATAGTINSITLAAGSSATNNIYNENLIAIIGGTGIGQCRLIAEYVGSTREVIVDRNWDIIPSTDSEYQVIAFSGILLTDHGLIQAATATTITLATTASIVDDVYVGSMIVLTTGSGQDQARLVTGYVGSTRVATISPDWTTIPDTTSVYKIIPVGRAIMAVSSVTAMADAMWDEAISGHLTGGTTGAKLNTAATAGAGAGAGAIAFTYTLTSSEGGAAIVGADVWVTSDAGGANVLASGVTDGDGQVTFYLDAGTVYVWRQMPGWNFSNPDTETVA